MGQILHSVWLEHTEFGSLVGYSGEMVCSPVCSGRDISGLEMKMAERMSLA